MRCGRFSVLALLWIAVAGCGRQGRPATNGKSESTLKIGYGLTSGARLEFASQLITQEGLVNLNANGRPVPWLATSWAYADDGLALRLKLQPGASFHDGTAATADVLREALLKQLPMTLGPAYDDIADIKAVAPDELLFVLKRRSTLLLEGLNGLIHAPNSDAGTGPFYIASRRGNSVDLVAYERVLWWPPGHRSHCDRALHVCPLSVGGHVAGPVGHGVRAPAGCVGFDPNGEWNEGVHVSTSVFVRPDSECEESATAGCARCGGR